MQFFRDTPHGAPLRPATGDLLARPLLAHDEAAIIRELARQDMAKRREELQSALASDDWSRVAKVADYLATTADLLDAPELRAACAACTQAVRESDFPRSRAAASIILAAETRTGIAPRGPAKPAG